MIWESMQSVLPQCPDVHGQDVADVVDVEGAHHDRQEVPRQQQYRQSSASTTTNNDAGRRDLEAHHHLPLPISLAMERSLSLGGISWNDLCLYPDDDDDDPENHNNNHHHQQQRQHTDNDFIDNDECHLYAKDNPYNVRSDDDSFNDNISPPSASSCTTNKRRKIMLWTAIFGFMAAIAIALAIGMSVANKHSQHDKKVGAQYTSSENNASLEDNNNNRDMPTTSKTYHPTYSPTMFEQTEGEGPATPSSSSSLSNLDITPSTTSQMSSESPTLQPSSSVSVLSSTSGEAIVEDESVPIEAIQFTTPVPTQQSSVSNPTSSSASSSSSSSTNTQSNNNNLDLVSSGKDSSSGTSTTTTTTTTTTQSCLTIELQTDQHGEETSWTLHLVNEQTGALSKLIASVDTNTYEPNEKDVMELYLDPGKYRFTLKDSYGDGFCCSNGSAGYYILSLDGKELINGGYYRFTQSYDILVGYDPTLTMSERDLQWVEAHNVRRMDWHTRNGKSYVPLVWSAELAKDAYNWAQVLVQHCDEETWHETSVSEGENLAQNIGSSNSKYGQLYPPDNVRYAVALP